MKKTIAAALACAIAASAVSCGTPKKSSAPDKKPYSDTITAYCAAMNAVDPDALLRCMSPSAVYRAAANSPNRDDFNAAGKKQLSATKEAWVKKCGTNPLLSLDKVERETEMTGEQLRAAENYYSASAKDYGLEDYSPTITEGWETVLSLNITGSELEATIENTCCMVNVEGDGWKMIAAPASELAK